MPPESRCRGVSSLRRNVKRLDGWRGRSNTPNTCRCTARSQKGNSRRSVCRRVPPERDATGHIPISSKLHRTRLRNGHFKAALTCAGSGKHRPTSLRHALGVGGRERLERACRAFEVTAVYLFGSRADDRLRILAGDPVEAAGSDLDVAVLPAGCHALVDRLANLQVALDAVFTPPGVDLVLLDRIDALFQFRVIDGHRVFAADPARVDRYELLVMRRGAELLPARSSPCR